MPHHGLHTIHSIFLARLRSSQISKIPHDTPGQGRRVRIWNHVSANEHSGKSGRVGGPGLALETWVSIVYMVSARNPAGRCASSSQRRFWFLISSSVIIARSVRFSCTNCCQSVVAGIGSTFSSWQQSVSYHGQSPVVIAVLLLCPRRAPLRTFPNLRQDMSPAGVHALRAISKFGWKESHCAVHQL